MYKAKKKNNKSIKKKWIKSRIEWKYMGIKEKERNQKKEREKDAKSINKNEKEKKKLKEI